MKISTEELQKRFTYHAPKPGQPEQYQRIRDLARQLAALIVAEAPDCRETSLAIARNG